MGNKSLPPKSNKTLLPDFGKNLNKYLSDNCRDPHVCAQCDADVLKSCTEV